MILAVVDRYIAVEEDLTLMPGTWKVLSEGEGECELLGQLVGPTGSVEQAKVTVKKDLLAEIIGQRMTAEELAEKVLLEEHSAVILNNEPAGSYEEVIKYMFAQTPCEFVVRKNSQDVFVAERIKGLAGGSFRLELRK